MAVLFPVKGNLEHLPSPRESAPTTLRSKKWGYRDLQEVVGGTFEVLTSRVRADCQQVLIVNEDARLKDLPVNPTATELWQAWGGQGVLRGPALLLKTVEIE